MNQEKKIPLLVITGPTAAGKTSTAIKVARLKNGEIVSADSMLVYRYMDIGTAKPSKEEQRLVPHHMIDIVNPDDDFNVALYQRKAKKIIEKIYKRKKLPILAGGTGLYIRSVIDNYNFSQAKENKELRERLKYEAERYGSEVLHRRLREVDDESAARLHPNDTRRIIRALEVYYQTGKPICQHWKKKIDSEKYRLAIFGLTMERKLLYRRINERVEKMIAEGLIEEVKWLLQNGYGPHLTSMKGLGYKEIAAYLNGRISLDEAVYLLKRNTRRFAKRQLTWFRRDKRIMWIDVEKCSGVAEVAQRIIECIGRNILSSVENFNREKYSTEGTQ